MHSPTSPRAGQARQQSLSSTSRPAPPSAQRPVAATPRPPPQEWSPLQAHGGQYALHAHADEALYVPQPKIAQSWAGRTMPLSSQGLQQFSPSRRDPGKFLRKQRATRGLASSMCEPQHGPAISPRVAAMLLDARTRRALGVPRGLFVDDERGRSLKRRACGDSASGSGGVSGGGVSGGGGARQACGAVSARPAMSARAAVPRTTARAPHSARERHVANARGGIAGVGAVGVPRREYGSLHVHPRCALDLAAYATAPSRSARASRDRTFNTERARSAPPNAHILLRGRCDGDRRPVSAFRPRPQLRVTILAPQYEDAMASNGASGGSAEQKRVSRDSHTPSPSHSTSLLQRRRQHHHHQLRAPHSGDEPLVPYPPSPSPAPVRPVHAAHAASRAELGALA